MYKLQDQSLVSNPPLSHASYRIPKQQELICTHFEITNLVGVQCVMGAGRPGLMHLGRGGQQSDQFGFVER